MEGFVTEHQRAGRQASKIMAGNVFVREPYAAVELNGATTDDFRDRTIWSLAAEIACARSRVMWEPKLDTARAR